MRDNKKNNKPFLFKLIIWFNIIKICNLCETNTPFLKDGVCYGSCTVEEIKEGNCEVENDIIKTQWIDNIVYLTNTCFNYINMVTTKNDDLIILMSQYPASNIRFFYGLNSEGRGYFQQNNIDIYNYTMAISSSNTFARYESLSFLVKLKSKSETKEYIMEIGKTPQLMHVYDFEDKKIIIQEISSVFYDLTSVRQIMGAFIPLSATDYNYYLVGLLWIKYTNSVGSFYLTLLKFKITTLTGSISLTYDKKEIESGQSQAVSCYETASYYIICFYKNRNKEYIMAAFTSSLDPKNTAKIQNGNDNEEIFFKCVHFYDDIGAFAYYSNDNTPYAIIEFKKYCHNSDTISDYYTKFTYRNFSFYYNLLLSDLIKVTDKKIYYVVVSFDKSQLYIISIYNYDQEKLMQRIYKIDSFSYNEYQFYNTIRIELYKNFLVFGHNGSKDYKLFASLNIFSYPNSTDTEIDVYDYLLNNNEVKINNIQLNIKDLCHIENNVFGYILTGIKILEINKNNGYLAFLNGTEIKNGMIIDINSTLKLNIIKIDDTNNIYSEFTYKMKFACRATESEFEIYNKYAIDIKDTGTSNKEDQFFNSRRQVYTGRYSYFSFSLEKELIEGGCNNNCELCVYNQIDKCITCLFNDFEILDQYKRCNEVITTIIKTTSLEVIETTVPNIIIEASSPEIKEITIPTIIKAIPSTTIKTVFEEIKCSFIDIIYGYCNRELTDEMSKDIYLYIKNQLINSNFTEENLLIKTPSVSFQLTTMDYQKNNNLNLSTIDLGACEDKLREKYNISKEYGLIIFKIDIKDQDKSLTYVQYEVYHPETFEQLTLDICQNININITIPANLDSETLLLYKNLENQGYNLFNSNDKFYTDICSTYTTVNNTDILLIDRKKDIYNKYANITICQENCNLESYNSNSYTVSCNCNIQLNKTADMDLNIQTKFNLEDMKNTFLNYLNNSNFRVLKCYQVAIDLTTILKNIGRIIMTVILILFITLFIIFVIKGNKKIELYIKEIVNDKLMNKREKNTKDETNKNKSNNKIKKRNKKNNDKINDQINKNHKQKKSQKSNPPKKNKININESKNNNNNILDTKNPKKMKNKKNRQTSFNSKSINNSISSKACLNRNYKSSKRNNIFVYNVINNFGEKKNIKRKLKQLKINSKIQLNDQELNTLDYNMALILDKRTYFQYYLSLLKKKHLIIFTFLPNNDYNLQHIKIILFLLSFSLYFSINGFFFSDETMHQIYESNGIANYLNQIASIIYSSIIPSIINLILKQLSLSENSILKLKREANIKKAMDIGKDIQRCMQIKFSIFFILSYLLLLFFWYFISCFCGVYKNTQNILIIDTLISFGLSMLYPFGLNLLPGLFRIPALTAKKKDKKCIYKISSLFALIL